MSKYEIMGVVMSPGPIEDPFTTIAPDEIARAAEWYTQAAEWYAQDFTDTIRDRRVVSRVLDRTEMIHGMDVPAGSWVMSVRGATTSGLFWALHSRTTAMHGGRWAVRIGGTVVRCRSKQHARRLARFARGTVRRWRRDRTARP